MSKSRRRKKFSNKKSSGQPHNRRGRSLRVEVLEDRRLLAVVTVGNALDIVNAPDTSSITALLNNDGGDGISLREAIAATNNTAGADTIDFSAALSGQTLTLGGTDLEITDALTIDATALAQNVTIDANEQSPIFNIDDPTTTSENFDVTLAGLTLTGGLTTFSGGAIRSRTTGNLTIDQSTVSGNSATGNNSTGGGIWTYSGAVTLTNSTVSGNSSFDNGGGIWTRSGAVTLTSSTVTENSTVGAGGGVYVLNTNSSPAFIIENSIIAGNTDDGTGPDLRPDSTSTLTVNYSLIGNTTGSGITAGTGTGNFLDQPALLGPLADNGGPTLTHALLPSSPAIDAGNPGIAFDPAEFDQRDTPFVRVFDGRIDIGAYEFQAMVPPAQGLIVDTTTNLFDNDYGCSLPFVFFMRQLGRNVWVAVVPVGFSRSDRDRWSR